MRCGMLVVWYDGTVWWMYYKAKYCLKVWYVSVYKESKSRIRHTDIICNDLIYRLLERVFENIRYADRQTDRQTYLHHRNRDSVLQTEKISTIFSELGHIINDSTGTICTWP